MRNLNRTGNIDDINDRIAEEERVKAMLLTHKKKKVKLLAFKVKGDPCNTVFFCKNKEKGESAVKNHLENHKNYWK